MPIDIKGGSFALIEYGVLIDFNKMYGTAWCTWNGAESLHCTTLATLGNGFDRYGSSSQVSAKMHGVARRAQSSETALRAHDNATRMAELEGRM